MILTTTRTSTRTSAVTSARSRVGTTSSTSNIRRWRRRRRSPFRPRRLQNLQKARMRNGQDLRADHSRQTFHRLRAFRAPVLSLPLHLAQTDPSPARVDQDSHRQTHIRLSDLCTVQHRRTLRRKWASSLNTSGNTHSHTIRRNRLPTVAVDQQIQITTIPPIHSLRTIWTGMPIIRVLHMPTIAMDRCERTRPTKVPTTCLLECLLADRRCQCHRPTTTEDILQDLRQDPLNQVQAQPILRIPHPLNQCLA